MRRVAPWLVTALIILLVTLSRSESILAQDSVATPIPPAPDQAELLWESAGDPDRPLDTPWFLSFDPDGNLWVVDGRNNQFQIFASDGTFLDAWGTARTGEGEFDFVEHGASAFDAEGNLYVVDTGNHRVQKFGPDRGFLTAWGSEGSGDGQFLSLLDIAVSAAVSPTV